MVQDSLIVSVASTQFSRYAAAELRLSPQTIAKYRDRIRQVIAAVDDLPVESITRDHILQIKARAFARGNGVSRVNTLMFALRRLLVYCREVYQIPVLDPGLIRPNRIPKRELAFLSPEEVERFVASIRVSCVDGADHKNGLRFRALVEVLLGSAMRIGEVLSLKRRDIDFVRREAPVIGKGNKQRAVFFTNRALLWLSRYLSSRTDEHPALFVTQEADAALSRTDIWRPFARYRLLSGISKPVTPHLLRHTAATQLLFNGCQVGHIKEILGHERLETTCRYYLGLDRRAAKAAHGQFLVY